MHSISFHTLPAALLGLMLAISAAMPVGAQTLLFDFGGTNTTAHGATLDDDPVNYWNNINNTIAMVPGGQLTGAVTTTNAATAVNLVIVERFNSANEVGTKVKDNIYPVHATQDTQYGHTGPWGTVTTSLFPSFKLTGLSPSDSIDLNFYASRDLVTDNRETDYTVMGAATTVVSLNPAGNINATVTAENVQPTAAGEITITLGPGVNNNNGNRFTYLGVLRVDITSVQVPIVFTDEPDDTTVILGRPVTFTAAVNSSPPYTVQWMKDNVDIEGATSFSYTIPAVTQDLDNTKYSVKVSNLQFNGTSRQATLRVNPDNVIPTLVSGSSTGPRQVRLVFSEEMDEATAEDINNYIVDQGAVFLNSAELLADRKTVVLTPSTSLAASALVQPVNLNDLAGNALASTLGLTITVPQPDGLSFLFDFGGADITEQGNDDPLNAWNNVTGGIASGDGNVMPDLYRNNSDPTTVSLTIVSRFNGANNAGTQSGGPYPLDATRDSLFGNTALFQGLENVTPVIRLGGLNAAEMHDLVFYASRLDPTENRTTRYTVTGATEDFVELNAANNITQTVAIIGMRPDVNGDITIALTPGGANNTDNKFTYLGVLKVTPYASTGPLEMLTPVVSEGKIRLNWIGTGKLEWSTSLTGIWTPITSAPVPPYSEDIVSGQRKFFRLRP
ncbi:MAG: hypothetical protein V4675_22050 [Verrucomicrobiota bacterium]